jgi:hypothetical protein
MYGSPPRSLASLGTILAPSRFIHRYYTPVTVHMRGLPTHVHHACGQCARSSCMWAMRSFVINVGHALVHHACGLTTFRGYTALPRAPLYIIRFHASVPCTYPHSTLLHTTLVHTTMVHTTTVHTTLVHITLVQHILVHTALVPITRPLHLPTTRIVPMYHPLPKGCASDDKPIHRSPPLSALARPFGWVTPSRVWFPPALPRLSWHHFGAFSIYSHALHARHRSHAWTTYACSSCMWAMRSFIMHMGHALVHHTFGPCARSSCMWANNVPRLHRATTRTAWRHSSSCK